MRYDRVMGRNRDFPLQTSFQFPALSAGSASDTELPLYTVPVLSGVSAVLGSLVNKMRLRCLNLISGTVLTGASTNNFAFNINQWRAGAKIATLATYTFSSGNNLAVNTPLAVPVTQGVDLLPGDVVTVARVSSNSTGLANPVITVVPEWVSPGS